MRRSLAVLFAAACAVVAMSVMAGGSSAATTTTHQWKFDPTINAPWAMEGDDEELDAPDAAAGLCRSAPFNTPAGAYAPLAADRGRRDQRRPDEQQRLLELRLHDAAERDDHRRQPENPNNLVAGANDYRVCCDFTGLNDGTGWAYYSFDGGKTWGNVQVPALTAETGATGTMKKFDSAGDPGVGIQSRRSRLLREHRLQPGELRVGHRRQQFSRRRQDLERAEPVRVSSMPATSSTTRSGSPPARTGKVDGHLDEVQPRPEGCRLQASRRS